MATNAGNNPNAQKSTVKGVKEFVYDWEGKDRKGKQVRGEMRAAGENIVQTTLRRQGVIPNKIKKRATKSGRSIKPKDIAIFTRQFATMMKAGVPLLQTLTLLVEATRIPTSLNC